MKMSLRTIRVLCWVVLVGETMPAAFAVSPDARLDGFKLSRRLGGIVPATRSVSMLPQQPSSGAWMPAVLRVNDATLQPVSLLFGDTAGLSPENGSLAALFGVPAITVTSAASNAPWEKAVVIEEVGLAQSVRAAVEFSREVKMASSRVDQAVGQSDQARGNLLPSLSLRRAVGNETSSPASVTDPNTGGPKSTDTHRRTDHALTLKQPIVDPVSFSDWKRRGALVDSRQAALRSAQGDEYLLAVQAYLSLVSSRLLADLAKDYEKHLDELLAYVAQRAEAGASSTADLARVKARSLAARSARVEQEAAQEAAIVEFTRLTNLVPARVKLPQPSDLSIKVPATIAEAIQLGNDRNPELIALRAELEAADWDKLAAKGRFLPRLDFEVTDQKTWNAGGDPGLQHDTRAMLVLSWNILAGGSDLGNHQERDARREEARWKLDEQQRQFIQGLTSKYATLDATRSRLVTGYKELMSISGAAQSMSERMLAGNQSLLDLLDVIDRVYQARQRLVGLHMQEIAATTEIARLLGDGQVTPVPATEGGS